MCPTCGTEDTKVLETRQKPEGTKWRRHRCGNDHVFETRQIYEACYSPAHVRCVRYFATVKRRLERWRRDYAIRKALERGEDVQSIAERYGMKKSNVWRIGSGLR